MSRLGGKGWLLAACIALPIALLYSSTTTRADETALDVYVAAPDDVYRWSLVKELPGDGYTTFVLELVSQQWRTAGEVDRPIWTHWLTVVRPDNAQAGTAFLYIGGGSNRNPAPTSASDRVINLATGSNTVVAELGMVPNQPLHFSDAPDEGRSEDDLVAYSRVQYIRTGDPNWLVRLPMVKSGVRAMDAIVEFLATEEGGNLDVESFVVAGGSKRGWTTWLVGLVDPRVVAIVPIVIDALNTEAVTRHQYAAYGFFSSALDDYVRHGLYPDLVGSPEYREILRITDPWEYRHRARLALPKFMVNSPGDQFFTPDNAQFYFHYMPGEKHLRYVPNTKHNLAGSDALESVLAFYQSILANEPRPELTWRREGEETLHLTTTGSPAAARLWQATNPEARDFRLDTIGPAYRDTLLEPISPGRYTVSVETPAEGFTAFFVELTYEGTADVPLKFSTEVFVVPDVLPFADADPFAAPKREAGPE